MQLPNPNQIDTPEALIEALNDYVNSAEALLEEKNMVDLAGLDAVVDALCGRVRAMVPEEGREYSKKLEALNNRLSGLLKKMTAAQEAIKAELDESNARQKASRAYRKEPK